MVPTSFAKHHPQVAQSFHLWSPTEESDQKKGQDLARTCFFASYTWHSTLFNLHSTLGHVALHTLNFALSTPQSTLYILHPHFTLYTRHFTLHNPHFISYTLHSPLSTLVRQQGKNVQDCWNNLFHTSVLRDCIRVSWLLLFFLKIGFMRIIMLNSG